MHVRLLTIVIEEVGMDEQSGFRARREPSIVDVDSLSFDCFGLSKMSRRKYASKSQVKLLSIISFALCKE
jgi:hypothetical protein